MTDERHPRRSGKAVKVEVDGKWYDGVVQSWEQAGDGTWSALVTWRAEARQRRIGRFPAERIRRLDGREG